RAHFEQISVLSRLPADPTLVPRQYLAHFSPDYLFLVGDQRPDHAVPGQGVLPLSQAPLLLAGLLWLGCVALGRPASSDKLSARLLLAALALAPIPASLTTPSPDLRRAAAMLPLLSICVALGAAALLDAIRRQFRT